MYAPTFRGGSQGTDRKLDTGDEFAPDYGKLLHALEDRFGGEWYVFLRLHPQLTARHMESSEHADRLILLGDLLYHGPRNDLPKEYAPKEVIRMLNKEKNRIYNVRGNCDAEVDQMVLEFPILADYCFLEIDGRTIVAYHGHHHNPKNPPMLKKGDILLNGHTHIPANEDMGDFIYMNPGSVSIPKEGSAHGYMICEGGEFTWKDLDGNIVGI